MFRRFLLALVASAVVLTAGSANAITYGELDGNGHPAVGAMIRLRPSDNTLRLTCSGSLISPTVFLTASHCTSFVESTGQTDIWVTFDPSFDSHSKLLHGTMHTNPLFNQRQSDSQDIAVITLDKPVNGITPVDLPPAGLLDQMKTSGTLNGTLFTSVGYGTQEPQPAPGGIQNAFDGQRRFAVGEFNALNSTYLRISQNVHAGSGGTCSGDSGGPQFLGAGKDETNTAVSITITGDLFCFATNVDYRLDTPSARAFLDDFVTLPRG
jgi:secreted trypsin-like serine protease